MPSQSPGSRIRYLHLLQSKPPLGVNPDGRIFRLLTDENEIEAVEKAQRKKLALKLMPEDWATIGIVYEDQYIMILRDAVEFPGGERGTYIRILGKHASAIGIAVLPILNDKILLIRHFRHATRSFHLEIPRGLLEDNIEPYNIAGIRELQEEIGATPTAVTPLGSMHVDTGLIGSSVVLVAATITEIGQVQTEEAISQPCLVSMEELSKLLCSGQITDSFTLCAILLANQKGIQPLTKLNS